MVRQSEWERESECENENGIKLLWTTSWRQSHESNANGRYACDFSTFNIRNKFFNRWSMNRADYKCCTCSSLNPSIRFAFDFGLILFFFFFALLRNVFFFAIVLLCLQKKKKRKWKRVPMHKCKIFDWLIVDAMKCYLLSQHVYVWISVEFMK